VKIYTGTTPEKFSAWLNRVLTGLKYSFTAFADFVTYLNMRLTNKSAKNRCRVANLPGGLI
jgi:hypothetical protein